MSVRSVIVLVLALKVISGAVTDFYHSCEGSQICLFEFEVPGFYKFSRESTTVTRLQTARLPKSQIDVSNLLGLRDIFIKSEEGVPNPICQIVTGATEQCIDIHTAQKKPVTCCKVNSHVLTTLSNEQMASSNIQSNEKKTSSYIQSNEQMTGIQLSSTEQMIMMKETINSQLFSDEQMTTAHQPPSTRQTINFQTSEHQTTTNSTIEDSKKTTSVIVIIILIPAVIMIIILVIFIFMKVRKRNNTADTELQHFNVQEGNIILDIANDELNTTIFSIQDVSQKKHC